MHNLFQTNVRSDRFLLAASLALFAVAGVANTSIDTGLEALGAAGLAVGGVYGLARYAQSVSRKRLAVLALGLWTVFLGISGLHVVGLETVAVGVPVASAAAHTALTGLTWTFFLGGCVSTTFLGFREYAATSSAETPEDQVLEQDLEF